MADDPRLLFTPTAEVLVDAMTEHLAALEDLERATRRHRAARVALVTILHDAGLTGFTL